MTQPTRIYKHSSAGTDWAALALGAGLGLTLALQLTTVRLSDFNTFYSVIVSISRLAALVGTYFAVVGMFLIARIPWVERGVGLDRLVTSLYIKELNLDQQSPQQLKTHEHL